MFYPLKNGLYRNLHRFSTSQKLVGYRSDHRVTYEKDFGDGAYYKIVCTNDETGSKYINNSYFIRSTGEANIAGAEFNFSQDGLSFSATMLDFNNKAWGIINAQKR